MTDKKLDNPDELLRKAESGDEHAKSLIILGYAEGKYGFPQSPDNLLELANKGWEEAREYVSKGFFEGCFGIPKDLNKLLECAEGGWKSSQRYFILGYVEIGHSPSIFKRVWNKVKSAWEGN